MPYPCLEGRHMESGCEVCLAFAVQDWTLFPSFLPGCLQIASRLLAEMFITVLHGENEKALFNIHCKVQLLLESIRHCCGCENEGEIELADDTGQVKNLLQNQHRYASELLSEREICVLLSVTRHEGFSEAVFTPLLKDEGVINPKFLAKLGNWEDSKDSSTRVKSKKAAKKTAVLLGVPSTEGKRSPSPQGNRTKTMVSSPKQSRRP